MNISPLVVAGLVLIAIFCVLICPLLQKMDRRHPEDEQ